VRRSALVAVLVPTVAALLLAACSSPTDRPVSTAPSAAGPSSTDASVTGEVNVFAAASLKETFTRLGTRFESTHPGSTVVFSFGPSSGLATQINGGAPADVFASASATNMDQVVASAGAADPAVFARNVMEIAVPAANPAKVASVADLAKPQVKVALCQAAVPCGTVAARVLANARITVKAVSEEVDVKSVLTKVSLGEVDAGVVYVTDVRTAGDKVTGITIRPEVNASTSYPIAVLTKAVNAAGAKAFTDYVLSPEGATVMLDGGFAKP